MPDQDISPTPIVDPGAPQTITSPNGRVIAKTANHGKRGPDKVKRVRKGERPTPAEINQVAILAAGGSSKASISRDTRMSMDLVNKILNQPDTQAYMAKCREAIRSVALDGMVQAQESAVQWVKEVAEAKADPKAFELVTRGMSNLERVASSASLENKPQLTVNNQILHADVDIELDQLKKFLAING